MKSHTSNSRLGWLRRIAVVVIAALVSTVMFANPAYAQDDAAVEYQVASDDVAYTDVDTPAVLDLVANDAGPVDLADDADDPLVLVLGMEFGSLTVGIDVDGKEVALYEPMPSFSGVDIGEYMVCWDTVCAGAAVRVYVGTAACTISAQNPDGAAAPGQGEVGDETSGDSSADNTAGEGEEPAGEDPAADDGLPVSEVPAEDGSEDVDLDALFGDGPVEGVVLHGTDGDDVICGTDGPDTIFGGNGDDVIFARGGADELQGESGDDLIFGGAGDDTITGGSGDDTINGGDDDDEIDGDSQNDTLNGGPGEDTINGGSDADTISGGPGDDTLNGDSQDDVISGGPGDDAINGGADKDILDGGDGVDVVDGSWQDDTCSNGETYVSCETTDEVAAASAEAGSGDELTCNGLAATIVGTPGDDVLQGTWRDDVIVGLGGNDTISGQSGADTICGGEGDDTIAGQSGADFIDGGPGEDTLTGESQNDIINGGDGDDDVNGGSGDDTLDGGNGVDHVDGLWDNDTCDDAETAPNCETVTYNGESNEPVDPPNADPFSCNGLTATIVGTPGDDVIAGTWQDDVIVGLGGNDTIYGQSGADTICAGDGDDLIDGASQNDIIFGGEGNDTIYGKSGSDTIEGGPGDDLITGDSQQDIIFGGEGDDDINGGSDSDILDGGLGIDVINGLWQNDTCSNGETYVSCETIEEPDPTDGDIDGDGVLDEDDAFPNDPTETTDTDGDGTGDNADLDDDNDGTPDDQDAFPLDPTEDTDTDGDGTGDNADDDIDGDGIPNDQDAFPLDPTETTDTDGDGTGDNADAFPNDPSETIDSDGDGTGDNADAFPNDPNETVDTDGDGTGDNADGFPNDPAESADTDGDGVGDNADAFPDDETETTDSDGDGVGDNGDAFPDDPIEDTDSDGDGTGNNEDEDDDNDGIVDEDDAYPLDPDETGDADGDGIGDNADPDDDNDGVNDDQDAFPLDPTETTDTDGDGVGDNADAFPEDPFEDADSDGDGVGDNSDAFPEDPSEDTDTDGDGVGNNGDIDDDGDGVPDVDDAFPLSSLESNNHDNDSLGDNLDLDDDNDGTLDEDDAFPLDPTESLDSDGDGIGNNEDEDDDGDGVPDVEDALPLDSGLGRDLDFDLVDDEVDGDRDGDGIANADDAFPDDGRFNADADNDGVPDAEEVDNDGDGVDDLLDDFPNDPAEQRDSDSDGIGNNEDEDDDGDGVGDAQDAFPLDPSEFEDADGDGSGDNSEFSADTDGDGILDIEDPDRDGDLISNAADAFPDDPYETRDSDGDGIGNNSDPDDDGDGLHDAIDTQNDVDEVSGADADSDGVIDRYDLDPQSAAETSFVVTASGALSAATIISDEFIHETHVSMELVDFAEEDGFADAAAGPIVDFTLTGDAESFHTARISVPYDPELVADPAVWWLDESTGLWLQEGVDTVADPVTGMVSTTVTHFTEYVSAPAALRPVLVPDPNAAPVDSNPSSPGVEVVFLVDTSGSTAFDYIVAGELIEASDESQSTRTLAMRLMLNALGVRDRVSVIGFDGSSTTNALVAPSEVASLDAVVEPVGSGTDLRQALDAANSTLLNTDSDRVPTIVVISDGAFDNAVDVESVVGSSVTVHGVAIAERFAADVSTLVSEDGVYVASDLSDMPSLQGWFRLASGGDDDSDLDLIPDALEQSGLPTYRALSYSTTLGGEYKQEHWIRTNPDNHDSDGDLIWDSEELVAFDLRSSPIYAEQYAQVIASGFPIIYQRRSHPRISVDPISSTGEQVNFPFRIPEVTSDGPDGLNRREGLERFVSVKRNELLSIPSGSEFYDVANGLFLDIQYAEARLRGELPVGSLSSFWTAYTSTQVLDLNRVERGERAIGSILASANPTARNQISLLTYEEFDVLQIIEELDNERRLAIIEGRLYGDQQFELLSGLVSRLPGVDPSDRLVVTAEIQSVLRLSEGELDYTGAYRLVKAFRAGNGQLEEWIDNIEAQLGWNDGLEEPGFPTLGLAEANLTPEHYRQIELEIVAGRKIQVDGLIESTGGGGQFFADEDENLAWLLLRQNFGLAADESRATITLPACLAQAEQYLLSSACEFPYGHERSVTWNEFDAFLTGLVDANPELAIDPDVYQALVRIWDDIATTQNHRADWLDTFAEEDNGPIIYEPVEYLNDYFAEGEPNPYIPIDGYPDDPRFDARPTWGRGLQYLPNVITQRDLNTVIAVVEAYRLFGGDVDRIDKAWDAPGPFNDNDTIDGIVSLEDLPRYAEIVAPYDGTVADRIQSLIDLKLYDNTLTVGEFTIIVETIAEVLATVATSGASVIGRRFAQALYYTARGAQAGIVVVNLAEGKIVDAALASVFLVIDVKFLDATGRTLLAAAVAPGGPVQDILTPLSAAARASNVVGVNNTTTANALEAMGLSGRAGAIARRSDEVVATSEANHFAYLSSASEQRVADALRPSLGANADAIPPRIRDAIDEGIINPTELEIAARYFTGTADAPLSAVDVAARLQAYEIAGDLAIRLGDDFADLIKLNCTSVNNLCEQGLTATTLADLIGVVDSTNRAAITAGVRAAAEVGQESAEVFAKWAAENSADAARMGTGNPDWIKGASYADPALLPDLLSAGARSDVLFRLNGTQMAAISKLDDLGQILAEDLIIRLDGFAAMVADESGQIAWDILAQSLRGADGVPGYGTLQALRRLENGAPPLYYRTGGSDFVVGVRGNLIEVRRSTFIDANGVAVTDRGFAIQYFEVDAVTAGGSTTRIYGAPDFRNATRVVPDPQAPPLVLWDGDLPADAFFTTTPGDFTAMGREFQAYLAANPAELSALPPEIQKWATGAPSNKVPGYTWHHVESTGRMQLVDTDLHRAGHTGGNQSYGNEASLKKLPPVVSLDLNP